jgi:hypothetical protein
MLSHNDFGKMDAIGKAIAQSIIVPVPFIILYLAIELLGYGDWVRRNSVWIINFALLIGTIIIANLAKWVIETMRHTANSNKDDLLEKIKDLELDIDYIKKQHERFEGQERIILMVIAQISQSHTEHRVMLLAMHTL